MKDGILIHRNALRSFGLKLAVFILVFSGGMVHGQEMKNEEVDIVKPYQPLLGDAVKIQVQASPVLPDTARHPLNYEVPSKALALPFTPAEIKPLALPDAAPVPLQNNLIKAGFGNHLTPLVELYLSNGRNSRYAYGLNFHHLSSNGSQIKFQDQSSTGGSVFGSSYFENTLLSGSLSYDMNTHYLYGGENSFTDIQDSLDQDLFRQRFQGVAVRLGLKNTKATKQDMDYSFGFTYDGFRKAELLDSFPGQKEHFFLFAFDIDKKIEKIHHAVLHFEYLREDFRSSADTAVNYFSIIPAYRYDEEKLKARVGAHAAIAGDQVKLFPDVEVSYRAIDDYLIPYAGYTGSIRPNRLRPTAAVNPFTGEFRFASVEFQDAFGGIRGSYGSNISYNLRGAYRQYKNLPVYLPAGEAPVYFINDYYYEARVVNLQAEVAFRQSERLNLILSGEINSYDLDFDDEPWGIPKNKGSVLVNYSILDKIILTGELFAQSGVFTIAPGDSVTTQLKGFADLNFGATYKYKDHFGFWISFNNMANVKQREWYDYPYYGFRFMAGALLQF